MLDSIQYATMQLPGPRGLCLPSLTHLKSFMPLHVEWTLLTTTIPGVKRKKASFGVLLWGLVVWVFFFNFQLPASFKLSVWWRRQKEKEKSE